MSPVSPYPWSSKTAGPWPPTRTNTFVPFVEMVSFLKLCWAGLDRGERGCGEDKGDETKQSEFSHDRAPQGSGRSLVSARGGTPRFPGRRSHHIPRRSRSPCTTIERRSCRHVHADRIRTGISTPLMISHSARTTSNTNIGNHMNDVIGPTPTLTSCSGRTTTSRTDA